MSDNPHVKIRKFWLNILLIPMIILIFTSGAAYFKLDILYTQVNKFGDQLASISSEMSDHNARIASLEREVYR